MNLLTAFAVALKHKLRFEPYTDYEDLASLVGHLDTFAQAATRDDPANPHSAVPHRHNRLKAAGEYLGVSFARSNPRKIIKRAKRPLGDLPLEILGYLAAFTDEIIGNGMLTIPMQQTLAYNNIAALNDVLTGTDRVLSTPLPIAYAIAIAQITWLYVLLLPFQLYSVLGWVAIPATLAASWIILGILFIGHEIENPFGTDVNDLPLDIYCAQIAAELDIVAATDRSHLRSAFWVETPENKVMWPLSQSGWPTWLHRGERLVRDAVRQKTEIGLEQRKGISGLKKEKSGDRVGEIWPGGGKGSAGGTTAVGSV